jgi:tRNA dimethylallyltransferase
MNDRKAYYRPPLVVLAGPTAIGKTAVAIKLARMLNTEIISADSAQVYRKLDIGTAKPDAVERQAAKHHLLDLVEPDQQFSVADYKKAADQLIQLLWSKNKIPFLVGGTGLYIRAVKAGYAFGQKGANHEFRNYYEKQADLYGLDHLYTKLQKVDPAAAGSIHPNDRRRIIRALEVYELEGQRISEQVKNTARSESPYCTLLIGLDMKRETLYKKIERRVDLMLEAGWLEEVKTLLDEGYRAEDPGLNILGYRQLYTYLINDKKDDFKIVVENIKKETRNLAKRQLTWFRSEKEMRWVMISESDEPVALAENIYQIVKDIMPRQANSNS